jgi:UDP-glucose 4-epimerase
MGFHKFIRATLAGDEISIYGDGAQTRDFTFISDIVAANVAALHAPDTALGRTFNIGGGDNVPLIDTIRLIGRAAGVEPRIRFIEKQKGDVRHTHADISRAASALGYKPEVKLEQGLEREIEWIKSIL